MGSDAYVVYCHTNSANGKRYVGWAKLCNSSAFDAMMRRWKQHVKSATLQAPFLISNAIRKYGEKEWSHELLETSFDLQEIKDAETFWISKLNTYAFDPDGYGYNMTRGGDGSKGMLGYHHTASAKKRISAGNSGCVRTPEMRANTSATTKAAMTPGIRARISKAGIGRKQSIEARRKRSISLSGPRNPNWGKFGVDHPAFGKRPAHIGRKISASKKGWCPTSETRKRMSEAQSIPVACYTVEGTFVKIYPSSKSVGLDGFSQQQVCRAVKGQTKNCMHRGFVWKYVTAPIS